MRREYLIPVSSEPQSFSITLAAKEYRLTIRWFDCLEGGWHLDIEDPEQAMPIIKGIPLVAGCDLLEQYAYMEFGGELWIDGSLAPSFENLGSDVLLLFIVEEK